jgi:uncharacterized membrane protein
MASPASIARHPIHAILVPIPIGLWLFSLFADVVFIAGWGGPVWSDLAFYTMAGGIVGALFAAVPGFIDFLSLRDRKVRMIGAIHLSLNLVIVAMFAVNLWLRTTTAPGAGIPFLLSVNAIVLLGVSGWLGGEMVYVHGVGVEPPDRAREVRIETATPQDHARRA